MHVELQGHGNRVPGPSGTGLHRLFHRGGYSNGFFGRREAGPQNLFSWRVRHLMECHVLAVWFHSCLLAAITGSDRPGNLVSRDESCRSFMLGACAKGNKREREREREMHSL